MEKADNPAISYFNSNCKNFSSFSKKPNVIINFLNSISELISYITESPNEFMSWETLVDILEQPSNVFCTGKYSKYNTNTSQQSNDIVQNLNSDLSKFSDLPLSTLEKQ